jgi:hypothetical protein
MAPFIALAALVAAVSHDVPGTLPLRVVSDVTQCPSPGDVQSALRLALGEGEQAAGGWTLWYSRDPAAPAAERATSLLMELADPAGERLVSRRIPTTTGDCAAIGTTMAAVVERSLRSLGWSRGEPLPGSAEPAKLARAGAEPASVQEPGTATRLPPRLVLGAGPLFATSPRLGINLLLDARLRVAGPLCVRLGAAAFAGETSESQGTGRVALSSRTFSLAVLAAFILGPVELAGGPVMLLAADQASSKDLPKVGSGTRAVLAVGVGVGADLPLSKRWRIGLELDGARVAFAPEAYLDLNGTKTTVLAPAPWQVIAAAKLEFVPWP